MTEEQVKRAALLIKLRAAFRKAEKYFKEADFNTRRFDYVLGQNMSRNELYAVDKQKIEDADKMCGDVLRALYTAKVTELLNDVNTELEALGCKSE